MHISNAPAADIATALGITRDDRVYLYVTNTGWDNAWCEETGNPAAVEVSWLTRSEEGGYQQTDIALAGDIAGDWIDTLLSGEDAEPNEPITITVARPYLRFVHPLLAGLIDRIDIPAQVAA